MLDPMEKRRVLNNVEQWRELRAIRNAFSHDYPESDIEKADALNAAYQASSTRLSTLSQCFDYCQKYDLQLTEVPKCD